ncbi:hypothetical protein [Nocardia sp. NPDC004604]|uniref:hypothetical protein n=1 Tax=Nocardia sp. NPDC004604 TaxID=3157013 RepID=UPI0033BDA38C
MNYNPDDITTVNVFDYIRREQCRFFRRGAYDPVEIATMLVGEALAAGAENVRVLTQPDWLVVTADHDWIDTLEPSIFHNVVRVLGEPNSMFAEVLLTVFARHVITATPDHTTLVKGDGITPPDIPGTWARAIAFDRPRN